jgi:hypothetical protein
MKLFLSVSGLALALILTGCGETKKPAAKKAEEPVKPPEPVAGRYAFHQMYMAARNWAPDASPLRLSNVHLAEAPTAPGKAGAWQATFVSPRSRRAKTYTYSVIEGPGNLHKGVFAGPDEGWDPSQKLFPLQALRIDSDAAYETAAKKGADYAKKHPDMRISYLMEVNKRFPNPVWRVIWGESVSTSGFSVFVDASTGNYLQTMR